MSILLPTGQVTSPVTAPVTAPVGEYVTWLLRDTYIDPSLAGGLVEPTIPDKPTSSLQKYRLTEKGRRLLEKLGKEGGLS